MARSVDGPVLAGKAPFRAGSGADARVGPGAASSRADYRQVPIGVGVPTEHTNMPLSQLGLKTAWPSQHSNV